MIQLRNIIFIPLLTTLSFGQFQYNHPELDWQTFETEHFQIHFYEATEGSAREGAFVAEEIYPHITKLYDYEPIAKTDIIFTDTDDISNGAAYYYDNKIIIWASPLDFELRGSHRWLQNVITHEFTHIVSLQKAMKAGLKFPGAYFQWMDYEDDKRQDVLYGFPQKLVSYPLPGTVVPPWLAEGSAQFMYQGADWDNWDSHRDMILRDRTLNNNLLSFTEMNTFGKKGIGNESTYNSGYALCRYIGAKYGADSIKRIMIELSNPFQFSINSAIENVIGINGEELYSDFKAMLEKRYEVLTKNIIENTQAGKKLIQDGTTNIHPKWSPDGKRFAYLSNKENDFFGQTDLFVYELGTGTEEKIASGVFSSPEWHPNGYVMYYSKKPKIPNKYGSKFYDIYMINLDTEKEERLTKNQRAFHPVFLSADSSIAFLSTYDGGQNIFRLDLKKNSIQKMTQFDDRSILHGLDFDKKNNRLVFDRTRHHFRDIYYLSLSDSSLGLVLSNELWDERDAILNNGKLIYADDRSGVFNLFMIDENTKTQGYITNVPGGAFMPDVNSRGQTLYSCYENGRYTIALLDTISIMNDDVVGYSSMYFMKNENIKPAITTEIDFTSTKYTDDFTTMFIMPKFMLDYGTMKPGFYFYSSEILERLNLFGGASINSVQDVDLFFIFEFKRFYPTLFAEVFYLTRNIKQTNFYSSYKLDDNLKFRLTQFNGGLRFPLFGMTQMEFISTWQVYRAFVKESIPQEHLLAGIAYDYYKGWVNGFKWDLHNIKRLSDSNINPSKGFQVHVSAMYEKNDFIQGLNLSDAGTLMADFAPNNTWRLDLNGSYHWTIPTTKKWTLSFGGQLGWLSNNDVESFFNYFGGGMIGIKGYPFYSIEGTRKMIGDFTFRIPLFSQKHFQLGWFIFQNSILGFGTQIGDAWNGNFNAITLKKSFGIQWRIHGYSFYNFPTAISMELHRGTDVFTKNVMEDTYTYGNENRFYFTLLFGF